MDSGPFQSAPVALVYAAVVLGLLAACELGHQFGMRVRKRPDKDAPTSLGSMVGGLLGMLAFVLAFTFSMAASQHGIRKQRVLDEANLVGTAYLRADLLEQPYTEAVKDLLQEYVVVRLEAVRGDDLDAKLARSVEIHGLLWVQVSSAAVATPDTNTALVVQSINSLIDMHESRLTAGIRNRIPNSIWLALLAISSLTMMTLGAQTGLAGKRGLVAVVPLALAFSALIVLVVDLDRPQAGLITVGQQAMEDVQRGMGK